MAAHRIHTWQRTVSGQELWALRLTPTQITHGIIDMLLDMGYALGVDYQIDHWMALDKDIVTFMVQSKDSEVCTVLQQEFHMPL